MIEQKPSHHRVFIYKEPQTRRQDHPLPPQRQKVWLFILSETEAGRVFPSKPQIAAHMGWKNTTSVSDVLAQLASDGRIRRRGWQGRRMLWEVTA